jgi:hypothetical protein
LAKDGRSPISSGDRPTSRNASLADRLASLEDALEIISDPAALWRVWHVAWDDFAP